MDKTGVRTNWFYTLSLKKIYNAIGDPGLLVLGYTFRHPHDVPDLLFPQPHVSKEDGKVELLVEGEDASAHLLFVKYLVQHLAFTQAHLQTEHTPFGK